MTALTGSQLAVLASGLSRLPDLPHRLAADGHCAQCARPLPAGAPIRRLAHLPGSYTDQPSILTEESGICQDCVAVSGRRFLQACATAVSTTDGQYACRKSNDLAWWIEHPPEGPWTFTISTAQMQHIHWKAQVNYSQDVFHLCLDGRNHLVRRPMLRAAAEASRACYARTLAEASATARKRKSIARGQYLVHPNYEVAFEARIDEAATPAERALALRLLPGELWLLGRIQTQDPARLTAPPILPPTAG